MLGGPPLAPPHARRGHALHRRRPRGGVRQGPGGAAHPPRRGRRADTPGLLIPVAVQRLWEGMGRRAGKGPTEKGVKWGGQCPCPSAGAMRDSSGGLPSGLRWGCFSCITPQGRGIAGTPRGRTALLCPHSEPRVPGGAGVTLSMVGWRGHPGAAGVQALLITTDWGELGTEQPEAPPAAATCRGTPGLAGKRVPCALCHGADPTLVAAGGRGGGIAVNSSEQPQPRGTVQCGCEPWCIWQGGSCHCTPLAAPPNLTPAKNRASERGVKRESKLSVPPPSTPG